MRRALASLLLALFSVPLIVPALLADASSNLPSCCRREGKHHCSMGSEPANQEGLSAIQAKCPNYPSTIAIPGHWSIAFVKNSLSICISILIEPSAEATAEAQYRVSFSRSRQKRGPPSLLS